MKVKEFVKKMKIMHKEAKAVLIKLQEEIKDLMWQIRNRETKKLIKKFIRLYKIKKIISENVVELELLASMKTYLVVNVSKIAMY